MTMLHFLYSVTTFIFGCSILFEVIAAGARPAGALIGRNSMGYTINVVVNTVKRVFLVLYPPLIGVIASIDGINGVSYVLISCFSFSIIPLAIVTAYRRRILIFLCCLILIYSRTGRLHLAIFSAANPHRRTYRHVRDTIDVELDVRQRRGLLAKLDLRIFLLATWVLTLYVSAIFTINMVGAVFSDYGAIVYQLVGLVNALGTLVWAFILDPRLSRRFDARNDVLGVHNALIAANWAATLLCAPIVTLGVGLAIQLF